MFAREVKEGHGENGVEAPVRMGKAGGVPHREAIGRVAGNEFLRQRAHALHRLRVVIDPVHVAAGAQEPDQVAAAAASRLQQGTTPGEAPAQELIEEVDVDRSEAAAKVLGVRAHAR